MLSEFPSCSSSPSFGLSDPPMHAFHTKLGSGGEGMLSFPPFAQLRDSPWSASLQHPITLLCAVQKSPSTMEYLSPSSPANSGFCAGLLFHQVALGT